MPVPTPLTVNGALVPVRLLAGQDVGCFLPEQLSLKHYIKKPGKTRVVKN